MAGRMSESRRQRMSELAKARFAALPKDGTCRKCATAIVGRYTFCRDCWTSLTDDQRASINAFFVPGAYPANQTDPRYWAAIEAVVG